MIVSNMNQEKDVEERVLVLEDWIETPPLSLVDLEEPLPYQ